MRNGLISVDAYKKSRAFYIYERKLRYCIEVFFRVRKRASGNASMEKVLCVSVLVKFPRTETRAFLPQWKAGLSRYKPEWGQSPFGPCKVYRILIIMLAMRQKDLSSIYM